MNKTNTNRRRPKHAAPVRQYQIHNRPHTHENGLHCRRAWHVFANGIQVGGCCRTKAEAERELRSFIGSERAALSEI